MEQPPYTQDFVETNGKKTKVKKDKVTLQTRAKITLPPSRFKKTMKRTHPGDISDKAAVYSAACVEFLMKVMIKGGVEKVNEKKKKEGKSFQVLNPRQLFLSIKENESLSSFFENSSAVLLSCGVEMKAIKEEKREKKIKEEIKKIKKETRDRIKKKKL